MKETKVTITEFVEQMRKINDLLDKAIACKNTGEKREMLRYMQKASDAMSNLLQSEIHEVAL